MKETEKLPAGSRFLPGTSRIYLQECHRREANPKAATRLLAYIMRKDGMSIRQICGALNRPYTTVREWPVRAAQRGITGRYSDKIPGMPCRLDNGQLEQLREDLIAGPRSCGFESGVWTALLAAEHVRRMYKKEYSARGMQHLLHRIGFTSRRPRPRHPKSASESERKAFKKKARNTARYYAKKGYTVLALDESSHIIGWNIKTGWYPRGRPVTVDVSLSRKRFYSFGALADGEFYCMFYDRANSDIFKDFLERLHKKFGKILLFTDNRPLA